MKAEKLILDFLIKKAENLKADKKKAFYFICFTFSCFSGTCNRYSPTKKAIAF